MKRIPLSKKIFQVLALKCPNCGEGDVFKKDRHSLNLFPEMIETCPKCQHHYDREPGYFLGAMYASYALAVFEGLVTFIVVYFIFPDLSTFFTALIPALVIVLLAPSNYKLGRVMWMNLFPR